VFEASFLKYANPAPTPPPVVVPPPPIKPDYQTWTDRRLLEEIWLKVAAK
jgi:hypothetical protein